MIATKEVSDENNRDIVKSFGQLCVISFLSASDSSSGKRFIKFDSNFGEKRMTSPSTTLIILNESASFDQCHREEKKIFIQVDRFTSCILSSFILINKIIDSFSFRFLFYVRLLFLVASQ